MLRRAAPPAPRGRSVPPRLRPGVAFRRALLASLVLPAALVPGAGPAPSAAPAATASPGESSRDLVGHSLYVLNPVTARTRGSGNLSVDLARGQTLVLVDVGGGRALLAPSTADAEILRGYGVRKTPRYTLDPRHIGSDLVPLTAWEKARDEAVGRLRGRWLDLDAERAAKIFLGLPFIGMTEEQAEEALGRVVLSRTPAPGRPGTSIWTVGRRPRSAELRVFTEGRERRMRARTFEEFLATKTRAVLTFAEGVLVAIDPPAGATPGLNWP